MLVAYKDPALETLEREVERVGVMNKALGAITTVVETQIEISDRTTTAVNTFTGVIKDLTAGFRKLEAVLSKPLYRTDRDNN